MNNYISNQSQQFEGKVIIVTGSTQGSGAETAKLFAARGAKAITICGRQENKGAEIKKEIEDLGSKCLYVKADLSKVEDCKKIAEKLRKQNPNTLYSGRTLKDILERFDLKNYKEPRSKADKKNVKIIKDYLKISCPIDKAPEILNKFFKKNKLNLFISNDYFPVTLSSQKKIKIKFSTNINRSLEYYSGMVFNITVNKKGKQRVLLSGGRYDGLLKNLGSKKDTTAVGAAIDMSLL